MKNKIVLSLGLLLLVLASQAQGQGKYYTKSGKINFYSDAPMEDIEAKNKSAVCVLDTKTGALQFSVLMKGFEFENYVESNTYPKAEFKGFVVNNTAVNYAKPGTYPVQVKGLLTIHGVTKEVQTPGAITIDESAIKATAAFYIQVADYNIKIPSLVKDKIAKSVKITVESRLDPLK
jgi:hypothetical protein